MKGWIESSSFSGLNSHFRPFALSGPQTDSHVKELHTISLAHCRERIKNAVRVSVSCPFRDSQLSEQNKTFKIVTFCANVFKGAMCKCLPLLHS